MATPRKLSTQWTSDEVVPPPPACSQPVETSVFLIRGKPIPSCPVLLQPHENRWPTKHTDINIKWVQNMLICKTRCGSETARPELHSISEQQFGCGWCDVTQPTNRCRMANRTQDKVVCKYKIKQNKCYILWRQYKYLQPFYFIYFITAFICRRFNKYQ